jgi:hypothetical protein
LIGTPLPTNQHDEQKLSRKEKQERYAQLPVWQQEVLSFNEISLPLLFFPPFFSFFFFHFF